MNARPYIFGCLCLVGANGTAVASDVDLTGGLLSMGGAVASSSFEGAGRSSQGGRDGGGGDVSSRPVGSGSHAANHSPVSSPADTDDDVHGDTSSSARSPAPNWQSLLPGSMF